MSIRLISRSVGVTKLVLLTSGLGNPLELSVNRNGKTRIGRSQLQRIHCLVLPYDTRGRGSARELVRDMRDILCLGPCLGPKHIYVSYVSYRVMIFSH